MFALMQYVDKCDRMGIRCHLRWHPRDANVEADGVTKFCVDDFHPNLRLPVTWSELDLSVLIRLLEICNFRLVLDSVRAAIETWWYQVREISLGLIGCSSFAMGVPLGASSHARSIISEEYGYA